MRRSLARYRTRLPEEAIRYRSLDSFRETRCIKQPRQTNHPRVRCSLHIRLCQSRESTPQRRPIPFRCLQDALFAWQEHTLYHTRCRVRELPQNCRHRQCRVPKPSTQKGRPRTHHRRQPCRLRSLRAERKRQKSHHWQRDNVYRRCHHHDRQRQIEIHCPEIIPCPLGLK